MEAVSTFSFAIQQTDTEWYNSGTAFEHCNGTVTHQQYMFLNIQLQRNYFKLPALQNDYLHCIPNYFGFFLKTLD